MVHLTIACANMFVAVDADDSTTSALNAVACMLNVLAIIEIMVMEHR